MAGAVQWRVQAEATPANQGLLNAQHTSTGHAYAVSWRFDREAEFLRAKLPAVLTAGTITSRDK